jgi:hypothetical protein
MKAKNFWILLLCLLAGLTVGNFCGELLSQVSVLKFLNYGQSFGLENPLNINLGVIFLSVQIKIYISLMGVLGLLGGIFVYKKI